MHVKMNREKSFMVVGPAGPTTTVLAAGAIVDLPDGHATTLLMQGHAERVDEKAAKAETDAPKAARPRKK